MNVDSFEAFVDFGLSFRPVPSGRVGFEAIVAAIYLAFRIRIDEALFELLSEDPARAPASLDQFLATHHLRKSNSQRNITDRCRGAIRLWRSLVGIILIQFATLALATLPRLQ